MMTFPWLPASIAHFLARWWKLGAGIILGALLMFGPAHCVGGRDMKARIEAQQAKAKDKVQARDAAAKDAAAIRRDSDTAQTVNNDRDRTDAVLKSAPGAASGAQLDLGCVRLRQQRTPADRLPARCRSPGGAQAPTQH